MSYGFEGLLDLEKELEEILNAAENSVEILEKGAEMFVSDLLKLPKPKSAINKPGYTHLVDSFSYRRSKRKKGEVEVGWGVYWGRLVEEGTRKSPRQPHLQPTFKKNKDKYYQAMIKELKLD